MKYIKLIAGASALSVLLAFIALIMANNADAAEPEHKFRLDVYGATYHFDRCRASCTKTYNEVNAGLGIVYEFSDHVNGMVGFFKNSFDNNSKFAAFNLGKPLGHFTPGILLGVVDGYDFDDRDEGDFGPLILPNVSFNYDRFQINVGYIPADFGGKSSVLTLRGGIRF